MPSTVHATSIETPPPGSIGEEVVDHPLSPTQDYAQEAIVSSIHLSNFIIIDIKNLILCSIRTSQQAVTV